MTSNTHSYNPASYYMQNSVLYQTTTQTTGGELYKHILPSDFLVSSNQNNDNPLIRNSYKSLSNYSNHNANNHLLQIYTRSETVYSRYTLTSSLISIDREKVDEIFIELSYENDKEKEEIKDVSIKFFDFIINNKSMHELILSLGPGIAPIANIDLLFYKAKFGAAVSNNAWLLSSSKDTFATMRDRNNNPMVRIYKIRDTKKNDSNISKSCDLYKIVTQIWGDNQNMMKLYGTLIINRDNIAPKYNVLFFDKQHLANTLTNLTDIRSSQSRELLSLLEFQNVIPTQTNYIPSIEFDRNNMNCKLRLNVTYPEYDINIYNKPDLYCMIPLPTKTNGIKIRLNGHLGTDSNYTDNKRVYVYEVYMNEDNHKITNEILKGKINDEIVINNHFLSQPIVTNYTEQKNTENKHGNYVLIEVKSFDPITDYVVGGYIVYK